MKMEIIVSKNLKLFRESLNFTQDKVASYLDIDRGRYANYESGNREMPYQLMEKICELYGIGLISLYEEDEQKVRDELVCAFRTDNLNEDDLRGISSFKKIVRNYLKLKNY